MTPCEKRGWKVGDVFENMRDGEISVLHVDDGSYHPLFMILVSGSGEREHGRCRGGQEHSDTQTHLPTRRKSPFLFR